MRPRVGRWLCGSGFVFGALLRFALAEADGLGVCGRKRDGRKDGRMEVGRMARARLGCARCVCHRRLRKSNRRSPVVPPLPNSPHSFFCTFDCHFYRRSFLPPFALSIAISTSYRRSFLPPFSWRAQHRFYLLSARRPLTTIHLLSTSKHWHIPLTHMLCRCPFAPSHRLLRPAADFPEALRLRSSAISQQSYTRVIPGASIIL